jgi:hypothetical protein
VSSVPHPGPTQGGPAAASGEVPRDLDPADEGRLRSLAPGTMLGGCEIMRLLGAGAYGEVYLGVDADNWHWAIKRMQLIHKDDRKARQRFLQEARILQYAKHPNIVLCGDYGAETNGNLWMKLEYLEGSTLRDLLHHGGPMSVERALRLGRQACQGLQVLHQAQAAHRDVKPENLFLIEGDLLKILDFGLVKVAESSLKTTGRIALGTALYFAPDYLERDTAADGDAPDPRWDVYSLGITLYELLVAHPFVLGLGKVPVAMVAAKMHLNGEIPPLAEHGIPEEVAAVIMKAVARDPKDRYADGATFERALAGVHQRWLAAHLRETAAPRSTSAKVRLGGATTEPDVVQQLARGSTLPPAPARVPAAAATAAVTETATATATATTTATATAMTVIPGVEATTRLPVPPAWVERTSLAAGASSTAVEEVPPTRRTAEDAQIVELPPLPPPLVPVVQRTEPLDRAQLRIGKVLPFVRADGAPIALNAAASEPPPAGDALGLDVWPEAEGEAGEGVDPLFADEVPLPRDPAARDAAELEVWRALGHVPPEVASKLGVTVVTTPAPAAAPVKRDAARAAPAPVKRTAARAAPGGEHEAREHEAREHEAVWHLPRRAWLATGIGVAVGTVLGLAGMWIRGTPRGPHEDAVPASATIASPPKGAAAASMAPAPSAGAGSATGADAPAAGTTGAAATAVTATSSATAAPSTTTAASATASAAASATAAPTSSATAWTAPKPKSSRADDLYPYLFDEDDPAVAPKPVAPKPTAKTPATPKAPPKPTASTTPKKAPPKPAGPSPWGDKLDD